MPTQEVDYTDAVAKNCLTLPVYNPRDFLHWSNSLSVLLYRDLTNFIKETEPLEYTPPMGHNYNAARLAQEEAIFNTRLQTRNMHFYKSLYYTIEKAPTADMEIGMSLLEGVPADDGIGAWEKLKQYHQSQTS